MNTLILLVESGQSWCPEEWVIRQGGLHTREGPFVLGSGANWMSVDKDKEVLEDYEEEERERIMDLFSDPEIYLVQWKDDKTLEKFISEIPMGYKALVDNTLGVTRYLEELRDLSLTSWIRQKQIYS